MFLLGFSSLTTSVARTVEPLALYCAYVSFTLQKPMKRHGKTFKERTRKASKLRPPWVVVQQSVPTRQLPASHRHQLQCWDQDQQNSLPFLTSLASLLFLTSLLHLHLPVWLSHRSHCLAFLPTVNPLLQSVSDPPLFPPLPTQQPPEIFHLCKLKGVMMPAEVTAFLPGGQ